MTLPLREVSGLTEILRAASPSNSFDFIATSNNSLIPSFTGPKESIPVPSGLDQVKQYLTGATSDIHQSLFVILIGANDILTNPNVSASQSIRDVKSMVTELSNQGEPSFLRLYTAFVDFTTTYRSREIPPWILLRFIPYTVPQLCHL
jgi:hypothetical protein